MHICVSTLAIIDSNICLLPIRSHAIIWTNDGILLIGSLGTNPSEMLFGIQTFTFKKIKRKMLSAKWRPFCLRLNMLKNMPCRRMTSFSWDRKHSLVMTCRAIFMCYSNLSNICKICLIENWLLHTKRLFQDTWWRHQMEIFSAILVPCEWNPQVTGGFPSQRPVKRSFDVLFDLRLNKQLSKQSRCWKFETPWRSLWRHSNDMNFTVPQCTKKFTINSIAIWIYNLFLWQPPH